MVTVEPELLEKFKNNRELELIFLIILIEITETEFIMLIIITTIQINKHRAQIMMPKKMDKGLIGIHFDSVDIHQNKMAIIINDLSEENKELFLKVLKLLNSTVNTQYAKFTIVMNFYQLYYPPEILHEGWI